MRGAREKHPVSTVRLCIKKQTYPVPASHQFSCFTQRVEIPLLSDKECYARGIISGRFPPREIWCRHNARRISFALMRQAS